MKSQPSAVEFRRALTRRPGFGLMLVALLFGYQNCSGEILGNKIAFKGKSVRAGLTSGNGEGYDGKPPAGDYDRVVPGHRCGDPLSRIAVSEDGALQLTARSTGGGDGGECRQETIPLPVTEIEYRGYNPDFIARAEGVYERKSTADPRLPWIPAEALCRLNQGPMREEGFDIVLRHDEGTMTSVAEVRSGRRSEGPAQYERFKVPSFTLRRELGSGAIRYAGRGYEFDLSLDLSREIAGEPRRFAGRVEMRLDGALVEEQVECRMAYHIDPAARYLRYGGVRRIYPLGDPIVPLLPVTANRALSHSVSPPLPDGLTLGPSGVISGSPAVATGATPYVVTATFPDGTAQTELVFATGARFTVNSQDSLDEDANPGDQICATAAGRCSLRAAVTEAGASFATGKTLIELPAGAYTIGGGDIPIRSSVEIVGAGPDLTTLDAQGLSRVFLVDGLPSGSLHLEGLAMRNGVAPESESGGCIDVRRSPGMASDFDVTMIRVEVRDCRASSLVGESSGGGGVSFDGSRLTVRESRFINNDGGAFPIGGAIFVRAEQRYLIEDSVFQGNRALSGGAIGDFNSRSGEVRRSGFIANEAGISAGAVWMSGLGSGAFVIEDSLFKGNRANSYSGALHVNPNTLSSSFVIANSTFAGNQARFGSAAWLQRATDIRNSTFVRNTTPTAEPAGSWSGAVLMDVASEDQPIRFANTIMAENADKNCNVRIGTLTSLGHNIDDGSACGLSGPGDLTSTDPMVTAHGDLFRPVKGGPAEGSGGVEHCPFADQQGMVRRSPGDAACDRGAVEAR